MTLVDSCWLVFYEFAHASVCVLSALGPDVCIARRSLYSRENRKHCEIRINASVAILRCGREHVGTTSNLAKSGNASEREVGRRTIPDRRTK